MIDATSRELSNQFVRLGRNRNGQIEVICYDRGPNTGVALLSSSLAQAECETSAMYFAGDHDIVISAARTLSRWGPWRTLILLHVATARQLVAE